jgi:hypothetical protein
MSEMQERSTPDGPTLLIDPEVASGRYANLIRIDAREEDFMLDMLVQSASEVILVGRYFISPGHARRLHALLGRQIERQDQENSDHNQSGALSQSKTGSPGSSNRITKKKASKKKASAKKTASKKTSMNTRSSKKASKTSSARRRK